MDGFSDLSFFSLLIKHGSLAAAAQQIGVTPPAVSKRLAAIERSTLLEFSEAPTEEPLRITA